MEHLWKFLTALIAAFALWVAMQQWWINREKLRLDLYSKRHAVFDATRKFIAAIVREGRVDFSAQTEFWAGTADATFLFGADVTGYIETIHKNAAQMHLHAKLQDSKRAPMADHVDAESRLLIWFSEQLRDDGLASKFGPYLRFQDLQGPLDALWRVLRRR
jgi:hypothetical protein